MKMASLAIDQKILNNYSKPSLDQTKRYLSQARAKCNGINIPTSFIYRSYLQKLANNLLNIENDITKSVKKIDEVIAKYNNVERRTAARSNQLYSLVNGLNFDEMSSSTGSAVAKTVNSNAKVENASKKKASNDLINMLKNTGSKISTGAKSLLNGIKKTAKKRLESGADFLLTAGTVIATPFTAIWDLGKGIFKGDWSFSGTKGMWGASVSLVKEEDTFKRLGASVTNGFVALTKGLAHLGEALLKFNYIMTAVDYTIGTGLIDIIRGISTGDWDWKVTKELWKKTKAIVSRQYVNEAYDWFYNTKIGKTLDKYAYEPFKSDGVACQILDGVGYAAGIIVVTVLTFGTATPMFLAVTATSAGIGKYTSEEWNKNTVSLNYNGSDIDMQIDYKKYSEIANLKNGESTMISQVFQLEDGTTQEIKFKIIKKEDGTYEVVDMQGNKVGINGLKESSTLKGLLIGNLKGRWEGLQYYVGGEIGIGNFKCLTSLVNNPLSKALLRSGIRVALDTVTGAAEVPFETIVTKLSDGVSWKEAWNKSGGLQEVRNQAIMAGGMSLIGEGIDFGKVKVKSMKTGKSVSAIFESEFNSAEINTKIKSNKKETTAQLDDINARIEANKNEWFDLYQKSKQLSNSQSEAYYRAYGNAIGGNNEYANVIKRMEELKLEMNNLQNNKALLEAKLSQNVNVRNLDEKIAIADNQVGKGMKATVEIENTSQLTMQQLVNIKNSDSKMFSFDGYRLSANDIMEVKSTNYVYTILDYNEKYHNYLSMLDGASDDLKAIMRIADEGKTISIPASEINNYNAIRAAQSELNQIKTRFDLNKAEFDLPTRVAYIDKFLKNSDDSAREAVIKKLMELSGSNTPLCEQFADNLMILKNKYRDFKFEIEPNARAHWSSNAQKIVLDDNFSQTTLFHELGHAMFDTGYDGIAPSNFGSIKTTAAENLRHNRGGSLDSFKKYIFDSNESYKQISKKQTELFDRNMASEIYSSITKMYDDDINSIEQILKECGFDDNQVLDLLNGNSRNDTIDMVYNQYRKKVIKSNTEFEFETTGDSAVHDIISSIYDGGTVHVDIGDKRYGTIFGHDKGYYKGYYDSNGTFVNYTTDVSNDLKTHEQIANFVSLKLQHKDDKLKVLRDMLGDEWYNMMDSIYKNIIGG